MKRTMTSGLLAMATLAVATGPVRAGDRPPPPSPAPIVYFDIAGPDAARLRSFYGAAFGWKIGPSGLIGRDSTGVLDGTLRQDPAQKILYLGVPDVTAALAAVTAEGGKVVQPRFVVPGVVILGLFTDPAGNPMGVVEMKDGRPVIPPAK